MFWLKSKKILYFPGCLTSSALPEIVENYKRIFSSLKLDVHSLPKEICCGAIAFSNGYSNDFNDLKARAMDVFSQSNAKNIVTNSAHCLATLGWKYGFKIQHVTQMLAKQASKLPIMYDEEVSYYDSPSLRIYEEPRTVLNALGFDIVELEKNRDESIICGAEGGMIQNTPILANQLAQEIFKMCTTRKLVVADPLAYYHLRSNAPTRVKVLEISEVFAR